MMAAEQDGDSDMASTAKGHGPNQRRVDLNSDMGEGYGRYTCGDDAALLEIVSSANVACGFHAGDAATMRRVSSPTRRQCAGE